MQRIKQIREILDKIESQQRVDRNEGGSDLKQQEISEEAKKEQQIIQQIEQQEKLQKLEIKLETEVQNLDRNFGHRGDQISNQRDEISKVLQSEADNIILNYLFKRQNLVLAKFEDYMHKSGSAYQDQQQNYENLSLHVKGLIDTQQQIIQRKTKELRINPHQFDPNVSVQMEEGFDIGKQYTKSELLEVYQMFEEQQLLLRMKEPIIKEICSVKDKHQESTIISLGEVTLPNIQGQIQQYIVMRGGDDRVLIVEPNTFKIYKTLELHSYSKRSNIRWIVQIDNHILVQCHSKFGDILVYEDFRYVKITSLLSQTKYHESALKPLYFKVRGRHFLIFASLRGELYFVNYDKREMQLEVLNSIRPLELIQGSQNQSSLPFFDSQSQDPQSAVLCLKELQQNQSVVVGYMNKGLQIIDMDFERFRLSLRSSILNNFSVKDVVEIDINRLLVLTYSPPTYFKVDLELKSVKPLGDGSGKCGLSLTKLPLYNVQKYPFVLCKENDALYIFNPADNHFNKIIDFKAQYQADNINLEDNVIFDRTKPNVFYTDKNSFYLTKYEINPLVTEALRCYNFS
eukprot:403343844